VEGMEHHVSPATVHAIECLTSHLKKRPALLEKIKGGIIQPKPRRASSAK